MKGIRIYIVRGNTPLPAPKLILLPDGRAMTESFVFSNKEE